MGDVEGCEDGGGNELWDAGASRRGRRRENGFSARGPRRGTALLTPAVSSMRLTSGGNLYNRKKVALCGFKSLSLWTFITVAIGNESSS